MKTQSQNLLHFTLFVVLMLVVGCAPTAPSLSQEPSTAVLAGETALPEFTPTLTPEAPAAPATRSSTSLGDCLPENNNLTLAPAAYETLPEDILNFLNTGGTIAQLDQDLYLQGFAGQPIGVIRGDVNGDGYWDVAVDVINPYSPAIPPQAAALVYLCHAGQYEIQALPPPNDQAESSPIIRSFQDLNADDHAELVVSFASCGAHTCFETPAIFGWEEGRVVNLLEGFGEPAPNPTIEINGPDASGYFVLMVESGGIGSVGAGPQRHSQAVYAYRPEAHRWELFTTKLEAPKYRLHAVQDADKLARQEKYPEALVLYQQVISSTTLQDWIDPEFERAVLGAYARFRMILIYTILGDDDLAQATLDGLQAEAEADGRLAGYLDMARLFRRYGGADDPGRGCASVREYAARQAEQVLAPLGPQHFGYSNLEYIPEDICEWK